VDRDGCGESNNNYNNNAQTYINIIFSLPTGMCRGRARSAEHVLSEPRNTGRWVRHVGVVIVQPAFLWASLEIHSDAPGSCYASVQAVLES